MKIEWSDEKLIKNLVETCFCKSEVLEKLNLQKTGGNFNTLTRYINKYNVDIKHFKDKVFTHRTPTQYFENSLVENSTYCNTSSLKNRLYKFGLKERMCELCGQDENWKGKIMSLILDHKNGIRNDNRIENLRIVCPNCNATLETHCRGSRGLEEKVIKERKKYTRKKTKKCSIDICDNLISSDALKCSTCYKKSQIYKSQYKSSKISFENLILEIKELGFKGCGKKNNVDQNTIRNWYKNYVKHENKENVLNINVFKNDIISNKRQKPPYEEIVESIKMIGYVNTGKKYGVSDNAVRKWLKNYIKNENKDNVLNINI